MGRRSAGWETHVGSPGLGVPTQDKGTALVVPDMEAIIGGRLFSETMKHSAITVETPDPQFDLRTGSPYAALVNNQRRFAADVGNYFGVSAEDVIPTSGATGAIEAIRNHIFRLLLQPNPVLLTVSPGYWRARESFHGFGFKTAVVETIQNGFDIDEATLIRRATELQPAVVYLSLPNNPTGAIFDAALLMAGIPERTAVILDFTLPGRQLDTRGLVNHLYRQFQGRGKLFFVGSTSKSHSTAEYRIGWAICANSKDAELFRQENRNVVSSVSVQEAAGRLNQESPVKARIEKSFCMLRERAGAAFQLVEPARRVESSYTLIRFSGDAGILRNALAQHRIAVMWGTEFGLPEDFIRLEVSEPESVQALISVLQATPGKRQSA